MKINRQISDTFFIGALLAIVGGFLDAYTYLSRGHVFANAQTGNIVLLGIHLIEGHYIQVLYYLFPIMSFVVGIFIAELIKYYFKEHPRIHWRQLIIFIEIVMLAIVSFLPQSYNMLCNIMVSFVCSLQVEGFRKFNGNPYASTMCTGNLRSATEHLFHYIRTKKKDSFHKSLQYYFIILFFIIGAGLGAFTTNIFSINAVLFSILFLILIIMFMFIKQEG